MRFILKVVTGSGVIILAPLTLYGHAQCLGAQPTDRCRVSEGVRLNRFTLSNTGETLHSEEVRSYFGAEAVHMNSLKC